MSDLKLKTIASIVILTVIMSSLSAFTAGTANACTYSPYDLNHDGIINMKDFSIFAAAWGSTTGDANFNPACDFNKDGKISAMDLHLLGIHWTEILEAHVRIIPHTLNLKSCGNWITCIISLPEGVNASDVEISSITLNNTIAVNSTLPICSSSNHLIVKFRREAVITLIRQTLDSEASVNCGKCTRVTLTISGTMSNGLKFLGSDTIRVIHCNRCND